MSFLKSFQNNSVHSSYPFDHWELTEPLTDQQIREICEAKVPEVKIDFDGTRAVDGGAGTYRSGDPTGGKAGKIREFVTKDNYKEYPHLKKFIDELCKMETAKYIGSKIKKDLTKAYVRVEIIADRVGFWLKPHCDIKEKLMSCLCCDFYRVDNDVRGWIADSVQGGQCQHRRVNDQCERTGYKKHYVPECSGVDSRHHCCQFDCGCDVRRYAVLVDE